MRTAALTVGATVLLTAAVAVSAEAITTHPRAHRHDTAAAAPGALDTAITNLKPYAYWPLNGTDGDAAGSDPLVTAGGGSAVGHSASNPAGSSGGSARFTPGSRQAGQYLRTTDRPGSGAPGTVAVWFRLAKALPGWTQTLVADNGTTTGWGAGLFVDTSGRLVVSDSSATVYSAPGSDSVGNNFCHRPGACPHTVTAPLNDGQWHMAAFVDQYNIGTATVTHDGWKPSLLYVDGQRVDSTIEGTLLTLAGGNPSSRLLIGAGQRSQAAALGKWSGNIAHVALFDRLLTANQISSIWQAGN